MPSSLVEPHSPVQILTFALSVGRFKTISKLLRETLPIQTDGHHAASADAFQTALERQTWAAILVIAGSSDFDTPAIVRVAQRVQPQTPLIVIADQPSLQEAVRLMRLGATGYVGAQDVDGLVAAIHEALTTTGAPDPKLPGEEIDRTRANLQRERDNLNAFLKTTQEAIMSIALPDRRLIFASTAHETVYGYPAERFMEDSEFFRQVVHPDDLDIALAAMQQCLREGYVELDHRIVRRDGQVRWLHRRAWISYDSNGSPAVVNDSAYDITEQKTTEEALRQSEELYRLTLSNISVAVFVTDSSGAFTFIGPNALAAFGYTESEVAELGHVSRLLGDDLFESSVLDQEPETAQIERRIRDKYGNERHVLINVKHVAIGHGSRLYTVHDVTDRARIEEELQLLQTAVQQSTEALMITDMTPQVVFASPAFAAITGFPIEAVVGMNPFMMLDDNADLSIAQDLLSKVASGLPFTAELATRRKDGGMLHLEWSSSPMRDTSGAISQYVTILRDVTERKTASLALQASEKQLRSLIDSQTNYLIRTDLTGRYLYSNAKFEEDFGWLHGADGLVGAYSLVSICDYHHQRTRDVVERCLTNPDRSFKVELDKPSRDGGVRTTLWEFICLSDAAGQPEAIQCVGIDITDLKEAQARAESQADLLNLVSDAIISADSELCITTWNRAATEIYGWTVSEALGQPIDELLRTEWSASQQEEARQQVQASRHWSGEIRQSTKDGRRLDILASVSPIHDRHGVFTGGVTLNRDITEQKRQQILKARIGEILESVVESDSLSEILEMLVLAIEEFEPDIKASVLLLDASTGQLRHGAAPSLPDSYNAAVDGIHIGTGVGSCGTAAFEKRLVVVEDILTDPLWQDFRDLASAHGLRACWSQPILRDDGSVLGTFAMYYANPRRPSAVELDTIRLAAHIAGIAIRHTQDGTALRQSQLQFQQFMHHFPGAVLITDPDDHLVYCNERFAATTSSTAADLIGKRTEEYRGHHPFVNRVFKENEQVLQENRAVEYRHSFPELTGQTHWLEIKFPISRENQPPLIGAIVLDVSAEQRAQDALRQSEMRYRQMFERVRLPKLILDPVSAAILDANPAAVEYYGYSLETLKTMSMFEINIAPPEFVLEKMASVLRGEVSSCTFVQRMADGSLRDVEGYAAGISLDGQNVLYCTYIDTTERNKARSALQEAHDLLEQRVNERTAELEQTKDRIEAIFNHSGDGIVLFDVRNGVQQANHAFTTMFELDPTRLFGSRLETFLDNESATRMESSIATVVESRKTEHLDARARRADGTAFDVEVSLAPVDRSEGAITGIVCIVRDVTERKQAALAVAEERNLLRTVIDAVPDYIYVDDRQQNMLLDNIAHARLLGFDAPEDVAGKPVQQLLPQSRLDNIRADNARVFEKGEAILNLEEPIVSDQGQVTWMLTSKVPVRNLSGEIVGLVGITRDITELKAKEEALQRSEAELRTSQNMLRLVLDTIPVRVFWKDRDSVYLGCNSLFAEDAGLAQTDDIVGMRDSDMPWMTGEADAFRADDQAVIAAEAPTSAYEETLMTSSGKRLIIRTSKLPLRNVDSEVIGILGAYTDITALTTAENALRESELRYRLLAENIKDVIVRLAPDGTFSFVTGSSPQLTGHVPEELVGRHSIELVHPEDRPIVLGAVTSAVTNHETYFTVRQRLRHKDGHYLWVETTNTIVWDSVSGTPVEFIGLIHDITDQKLSEDALRASEERYRTTIAAMHEGIVVMDQDGIIQLCNAAAERMLGLTADQMMGRGSLDPRWQSVHEDGSPFPGETHPAMVTLRTGQPQADVVMGVHKPDGSLTWLLINTQPLSHPDEVRPYAVVATFGDITQRKQAEESLQNSLTREKELGQLKSRFVSMASHEFRTPLAAILAATESLTYYRTKMTEAQIDERLNRVRFQVDHMRDIMEDILQLSRIQSGRLEFKPTRGDVELLCLAIVDEFEAQEVHRGRIRFSGPGLPVDTYYDHRLLRQAITNLVHNALKYSPLETKVDVELRASEEKFTLRIRDEGIGIPEADLPHLFEPFHRAGNVNAISGTGLGLSISKQAVELHGGTISVATQPGNTDFTVTIPLSSEPSTPDEPGILN